MTDVNGGETTPGSVAFPADGRRLVIYVVYDKRGGVDDFIPVALAGLREHATRLLVVVNGKLTDAGRAKLLPVADEILVRKNVGFDIWGHKDALAHVGAGIAEFDEIIMTNDTWFGPVRPYGQVFERMGKRTVDFWGMTDHAREEPNPFTHKGVLPYHLQSFWIAVRRSMFLSAEWSKYWDELPKMPSYFDAVLKHEALFTERFATAGFSHSVAFPSAEYPTDHPALFNPDLLIDDGCPVLKRRPLFHYPPFLDRHAVTGRRILTHVESYGFSTDVILQNLARNVQPAVVNVDAGLFDVLPDVDVSYDSARPLRIAAVVHVAEADEADEVLDRVAGIPVPFDLIVTAAGESVREAIDVRVQRLEAPQARLREVRTVPAGAGHDMSAFFIGCRDILRGSAYDLVVKVHGSTPTENTANHRRYFRRYHLENLLGSPGYFLNVLGFFQREAGLGIVFPPMMHVGQKLAGVGWPPYREWAVDECKRLDISVPLDGVSPLAPFGGMWIGRPEALTRLSRVDWKYTDYERSSHHADASLAGLQTRLLTAAAGELGYHARTILNVEHAGLSHVSLEYKVDQMSATLPGYPVDQIQFLHRAGWTGHGGIFALTRMYVNLNHPRIARVFGPVLRPVGKIARRIVFASRDVHRRLRGTDEEVGQ